MPYQITAEVGLIRITVSGVVGPQDLERFAFEMAALERELPNTRRRLTDLRAVERIELAFPNVLDLAEHRKSRQLPHTIRSAFVAPGDLLFGYARMFQTLNDHPQISVRIFATLEDAATWLASPDEAGEASER